MRAILLTTVVALSDCGAPSAVYFEGGSGPVILRPKLFQTFDMEVENRYAVSIFNVAVSIDHPLDGGVSQPGDGGVWGWGQAFMAYDLTRIEAFEKKDAGPFNVTLGSDVVLTFNVQSLGRWHNFSNIRINPTAREHFRAVYDYDLATAEFTLHYTE